MKKTIAMLFLFCCVFTIVGGPPPPQMRGCDHGPSGRGRGGNDRMSGLALAAGVIGLTATTLDILNPRPVIVTTSAYIQPQLVYPSYMTVTYPSPTVYVQPRVYVQPSPPVCVPVSPVYSLPNVLPVPMRPLPPRPMPRW